MSTQTSASPLDKFFDLPIEAKRNLERMAIYEHTGHWPPDESVKESTTEA